MYQSEESGRSLGSKCIRKEEGVWDQFTEVLQMAWATI